MQATMRAGGPHAAAGLGLLLAMLGLLVWRRVRTDVAAMLCLACAAPLGIVPADRALAGFADPVLAVLALLSVLGASLRGAGMAQLPVQLLGRRAGAGGGRALAGVLALAGFALSGLVGRTAARAMLLPAALQSARRQSRPAAPALWATELACFWGGLATLVGTAPNLLVAEMRAELTGRRFHLLDFAPVGGAVALAGLAATAIAWSRMPHTDGAASGIPGTRSGPRPPSASKAYVSELLVPPASSMAGATLAALESAQDGAIRVLALVREDYRRIAPRPDWTVEANDILVLSCEPDILQRTMERYGLHIVGGGLQSVNPDRVGVVEAVVTPTSELLGRSPGESRIERLGASLLAIGRSGDKPAGRLRRTKLRAGDVLVLQGEVDAMPGILAALGCLPLAERRLRLGRRQSLLLPAGALAIALAASGAGLLPLWLALLTAVLALVLLRAVTLNEIYENVPWPDLVAVGALLPLAGALAAGLRAGLPAAFAALPAMPAASPALLRWASPALALSAALGAARLFGGIPAALLLGPAVLVAAPHADALPLAVALGASAGIRPEMAGAGMAGDATGWRWSWRWSWLLSGLVLAAGEAALGSRGAGR